MEKDARPYLAPEGLLALSETITHGPDAVRGAGPGFTWETNFTPAHGGTWADTRLTTTHALRFNPAMVVWLGTMDGLDDRQAHTWRQTILRGPTANQQGLGGNDLPAGYVYDADSRTETVVYIPASVLGWAPHRLCELTVREVIAYRPQARHGLGLVPTTLAADFDFAPGEHRFSLWYWQGARDDGGTPSPWAAQDMLLRVIAPLLDTAPALIDGAPGWDAMAAGALEDLHHEACWLKAGGRTGLRAYVQGSSAVKRDEQRTFELMTQADVLLPLLHWRRATGDTRADGLIERLMDAVRAFRIIEPHSFLPNHYPYRETDTFMDTWYFYENALIKLPWIAHLTGDADLRGAFLAALEGGRRLAHNTQYLLPLFADADGWSSRGSLLNAGVSGMYAASCILASQMTGDTAHLLEAADALDVLAQLPPHMLTHEPQQLSFAAAAAAWLGRAEQARDLVGLSLRMGYWDRDPAVPFYDARGMFQACASLAYPAYKENVEVLWPWAELLAAPEMRAALPAGLMAAFANLQRCHNYAFFDPFLPEHMRRGPCPHIPYEDLATSEFAHTAVLGKELYGAGEVFWSALLFTRPGFLAGLPPDMLVMALDIPCLRLDIPDGRAPRRWLVYNPRPAVAGTPAESEFVPAPRTYVILEGS